MEDSSCSSHIGRAKSISICTMDAIFAMSEVERSEFLRASMKSFGCTYICFWSCFPCFGYPSNFLSCLDGYFHEENEQASSSSGSSAARHFGEYRRQQLFGAVDNRVPGCAFLNNRPYLELKEFELQSMASSDVQRRFYQEARIKTAVFMGCRNGEIEVGWSGVLHFNVENEIRIWFAQCFRQAPVREVPLAVDPNRPSSSSSSLTSFSLSIDSPENSSLLFNIPNASLLPEVLQEALPLQLIPTSGYPLQEAIQHLQPIPSTTNPLQEAMMPLHQATSTSSNQLQQAMHEFALANNIPLPTPESEDTAMTRAILAVLTSDPSTVASSASSSSSPSSTRRLSHMYSANLGVSAFKHYKSASGPSVAPAGRAALRRQSMLSRAIAYYSSLNNVRRQQMQTARPMSNHQLHHMIKERRRREKINESFQALRSLLPPETKNDKASVLTRTKEYLTSLKTQVEELNRKAQQLEAQLSVASREFVSTNQRLDVRVRHVPESTSEQRFVDLQVTVRGENSVLDMVIRILEFLKQVRDVKVISIEARPLVAESTSFNHAIFRLNIEGNEWDEAAFQEAVRRVVEDLAQT